MFTGIIETMGTIRSLQPKGGDVRLLIDTHDWDLGDVALGDSIAVNGCCLTVVELPGKAFAADVSNESLSLTTLGNLKSGSRVNLEKALTPTTRLGGHLVSGHVDAVGEIVEQVAESRSVRFRIKAPDQLAKYIAHKGSITVDGISLTVNAVNGAVFDLNIIPHTQQLTTIGQWQPGYRVNLEVDVIARYLERLLLGERAAEPAAAGQGGATSTEKISMAFLAEHGFLKG